MAIVAFDSNPVRTRPGDWRALVKSAIRDPRQLIRQLDLPAELACNIDSPHQQFGTFVPTPFLSRIIPGDPLDPLLMQVLPRPDEASEVTGFLEDAVGELTDDRSPGLIQKYAGRALLITRGVCAIHCRYCFRRHYPYDSAPVSIVEIDKSLDVIRDDPSIEEVILSGGDPLMMVDDQLAQVVRLIESIAHVRRLRIHTRLPVVIPQRVTSGLLDILNENRLTKVLVLHINHAQEIDEAVWQAVGSLNRCQLTLLNQSVLLRDVNDNIDALVELSKRLVEMNCLPYYLHQLDRVAGAAHFEVDQIKGEELLQQMRIQLPGYAVPRYVREVPGEPSKNVIM